MTKKRYLIGILSVVVIIIATLSIVLIDNKNEEREKTSSIELYFINDSYTSIVSEKRDIIYTKYDELMHLVLNELIKGPEDTKNKPVILEGTKLLSCKMKHQGLVIDFSKEFLNDDQARSVLSVYAIVKSMCQIVDVNKVLVTVEGNRITSSNGEEIGYMSDKDIDLLSDKNTEDSKSLPLYFKDEKEDKLVCEKRTIKITDTNAVEPYIINELIKGTQIEGRKSLLDSSTVLISAETADDVCFVNFKSGFIEKNTGNNKNEKLILYSIVNSLCDIHGIDSVVFLVDGKKVEKFGKIDISESFAKDESIIK